MAFSAAFNKASLTKQMLYPHQAAMLENWNKYNTFYACHKNGNGQDYGSIVVLLNRQRAICVSY